MKCVRRGCQQKGKEYGLGVYRKSILSTARELLVVNMKTIDNRENIRVLQFYINSRWKKNDSFQLSTKNREKKRWKNDFHQFVEMHVEKNALKSLALSFSQPLQWTNSSSIDEFLSKYFEKIFSWEFVNTTLIIIFFSYLENIGCHKNANISLILLQWWGKLKAMKT